jgi:hydrogenase maturation factor
MSHLLKALVIRDDQHKFKDVGDVVAIARSEGRKLFHTEENIRVIRVFFESDIGWIAVIGCSGASV